MDFASSDVRRDGREDGGPGGKLTWLGLGLGLGLGAAVWLGLGLAWVGLAWA